MKDEIITAIKCKNILLLNFVPNTLYALYLIMLNPIKYEVQVATAAPTLFNPNKVIPNIDEGMRIAFKNTFKVAWITPAFKFSFGFPAETNWEE